MTTPAGPQIGVTLYSFTNEWLSRQFELPTCRLQADKVSSVEAQPIKV